MVHDTLMDKDIGKIIEEEGLEMNSKINFSPTYYDREESRIQEWEAEKLEYAEEVRKEGISQTIIDFYNNGAPIDLILKATGLKEEDLNNIIKKHRNK